MSGPGTLNNVTITANEADADHDGGGQGGGLFFSPGTPGPLVVRNSIVGGNFASSLPDCLGTLPSGGHNLVETPCTVSGDTTGNVLGVSPLLGPLASNGGPTMTHHPQPSSPALNAGDPAVPGSGGTACEAIDQRGIVRPQNGRCDIGAVESDLVCSDGDLDPGETCDDGNLVDGDCCSSLCQLDAAGTPCVDDVSACTADVCDGAGACTHPVAVDAGCGAALAERSRVAFRTTSTSKMSWRWRGADAVVPADFGSPPTTTAFSVCVLDDVAGTPRVAAEVLLPSGADWTPQSTGFRLRNADRTLVAKLRGGIPGRPRLSIVAKTPALAASPLPLTPPVVVRLQRRDAPGCWESTFSTPSRSTGEPFKARGD